MIRLKSLLVEILKEAQLRGEWWFQDGDAQFADGDVGDMNHEAMVLSLLTSKILDQVGVDCNDPDGCSIDDKGEEILQSLEGEITGHEHKLLTDGAVIGALISYFSREHDEDALEMLSYIRNAGLDPRDYALKKWGWQRVKGNVIQTQTLTDRDLKNIVNGLDSAYADQFEDGEDPTFNIEVMATRSWYEDVPLSVLEKKNPVALNPYRSRYE